MQINTKNRPGKVEYIQIAKTELFIMNKNL